MNGKSLIIASTILIFLCGQTSLSAQKKHLRKYVVVPAWKVQVVNQDDKPMPGVLVRQVWQDYDVEEEGHEQDKRSDENGYVSFPERVIHTTPEARAMGRAKNTRKLGVHASFGPSAFVMAFNDELEGWVDYEVSKPLPTRIVMRPKILPKRDI
jgi:hypothetical protein